MERFDRRFLKGVPEILCSPEIAGKAGSVRHKALGGVPCT
jgi:hypothetical protein